jgi:hypothetical protein
MINLIEDNKELNFRIYNSEFIAKRIMAIRHEGKLHHANYKNAFKDSKNGSTWDYKMYNIFSLATGSTLFYQIYKDLIFVVKDYLKDQQDVSNSTWVQSWLNYHKQDEVLDWHDHYFSYHGYISIDPKDTTTEFKEYSIQNKPGNVYIGPGSRPHRVVVNKPYTDTRITLGFDLLTSPRDSTGNLSFIPII